MGVELRNFQRKFQTLMGEVKPQTKPRIVVWLDERLAEFKINGHMQICESLEDPRWIKDYYASKRESRAAAIKRRGQRNADDAESVQPKVEEKSESSNGVAHPDELSESAVATHDDKTKESRVKRDEVTDKPCEEGEEERDFQLVEVKSEQMEEDDDMIIVGESIAPPSKQSYHSQYNPMRQQMRGAFIDQFHRKRQRFGSIPHRPLKTSHVRPNFRSSSSGSHVSFPSHTVTSQSQYMSTPPQPYTDVSQYEGEAQTFPIAGKSFQNELLRIPPHLQSEVDSLRASEQVDYEVTQSDEYGEYNAETYDTSYLTEGESLNYDDEGNPVIEGDNQDSSFDPNMSQDSTSGPLTSQDDIYHMMVLTKRPKRAYDVMEIKDKDNGSVRYPCPICRKLFTERRSVHRHMRGPHRDVAGILCNYCDMRFREVESLNNHIISTHMPGRM